MIKMSPVWVTLPTHGTGIRLFWNWDWILNQSYTKWLINHIILYDLYTKVFWKPCLFINIWYLSLTCPSSFSRKGWRNLGGNQATATRAILRNYCIVTAKKNCKPALVKFAEYSVFNFSAVFQMMLQCQRKTCYIQKFVRATAMQ